ncbi:MAG: polysaccharide pyruvyl transferase family protein [Pseudomonadota bacterium]
MSRRLFVLVPPTEYTLSMPNLGDRALHAGMRQLLASSDANEILYDTWNSFPRMTLDRLNSGHGDESARIRSWCKRFQRQCSSPPPTGEMIAMWLLDAVGDRLSLWSPLDKLARRRTGQTGREAVTPRLFPRMAAREFGCKLAASDAVMMNAGGLLADHLAHYLPGRIFALAAAQMLGRPTALVNYSFAVTQPELLNWVAPVLRRVSVHAVRESVSRERLVAIGVRPETIQVVPDASIASGQFGSTRPPRNRVVPRYATSAELTLGIQVRGDRSFDPSAWAVLLNELRSRFNVRLLYLVGCLKHDPTALRHLRKALPLDCDDSVTDFGALQKAIGTTDLLITDRYHGMVFAALMGTPFIPFATTTHKSTGFLTDIDYPVDSQSAPDAANVRSIVDVMAELLEHREDISQELMTKVDALRQRVFTEYQSVFEKLFEQAALVPNSARARA